MGKQVGVRTVEHKGWYSRGYLPHLDAVGVIQFVTFRLADSLPQTALQRRRARTSCGIVEQVQRQEVLLDAGYGACLLNDDGAAATVRETLLRSDGVRYRLFAWCIMPNHVHVLVQPASTERLPNILHTWKSFSAGRINRRLGRTGRLWQPESFDRYIRSDEHLAAAIAYIEDNPVKAGLVHRRDQWRWSSASAKR